MGEQQPINKQTENRLPKKVENRSPRIPYSNADVKEREKRNAGPSRSQLIYRPSLGDRNIHTGRKTEGNEWSGKAIRKKKPSKIRRKRSKREERFEYYLLSMKEYISKSNKPAASINARASCTLADGP